MHRKISRMALLSLLVVILIPLVACKKKEAPPPAQQPSRVSATKAYEKYFGPPPTTDKGTCFAFVIYFPSAKSPGKVVPFPFFTFDEGSIRKVAVERLIAGMEVPAFKDEVLQPFSPGAHLLGLSELEGLVRIDVSKDFLKNGQETKGMLNALVLTIAQFEGVKGVRLLSAGKDLDFAQGTMLPSALSVIDPSPPRLLSVTAVKDKGAREVEEVSAYFDRPVDITELTMSDKEGKSFAGELFHSVFDMAAVLKPKEPGRFKAGMPVRVRWKVTDKLGRSAEGDRELLLDVQEH